MPCTNCNIDFNLFTWRIKCFECELFYCTKCLRRQNGYLICEKCSVLVKRPPDREKLMELKAKDLQQYLNKNHVSTHGLVEKQELVDLFYRRCIPVCKKRNQKKFSFLSGSVPNLSAHSQAKINNLRSFAEAAFKTAGASGNSAQTSPNRHAYQFTSTTSMHTPHSPPNQSTGNPFQELNVHQNANQFTESEPTTSAHPVPQPKSNSEVLRYPKLSDFESAEDLNELSVKQLKELLTLNRVDFKGCVEKAELLDRALRLWCDKARYKNEDCEDVIDDLCKICMDNPLDCVLLECGHMATCIDCGKKLAECPICRQYVSRVVRTFKA